MADNNTSTEIDEDEILNKVDFLLHKHQNQVKAHDDLGGLTPPQKLEYAQTSDSLLQHTAKSSSNPIPTLTEVVVLHPVTPPEPDASTLSLQQILDASLQEVGIDINMTDRIALVQALKKRIDVIN